MTLDLLSLSSDELISLMHDAEVNRDDAQYDACFAELEYRDALPFGYDSDFECGCYDDDAELESYSLECAFGPEE